MNRLIFILYFLIINVLNLSAWSEHAILARIALEDLPYWKQTDSVKAKSLYSFLIETEDSLVEFLEFHEIWAKQNLAGYKSRPIDLAFRKSANTSDIVKRFFYAIRINPNSLVPLYLYLMPGQDASKQTLADPLAITLLNGFPTLYQPRYIWIAEEQTVYPFDVLVTANDEPDYGFDIGLFEDNPNEYGVTYGFGNQPFGNPNIYYTRQAAFHMGFYHEEPIVYSLAPFLNQTYLEYRINLFKELSVFAFRHKQSYWGWRFLGWSMHYAGDASMPYHSKPVPGLSLWQKAWILIKSMLGFDQQMREIIQLVSNKHILIEEYQSQEIYRLYLNKVHEHVIIKALKYKNLAYNYDQHFIRNQVSKVAAEKANQFDLAIVQNMPAHLTSDPKLEISQINQNRPISSIIFDEKGSRSIDNLNQAIAFHLKWFGITIRTLLNSVTDEAGLVKQPSHEAYIP